MIGREPEPVARVGRPGKTHSDPPVTLVEALERLGRAKDRLWDIRHDKEQKGSMAEFIAQIFVEGWQQQVDRIEAQIHGHRLAA